MRRGHGSRFTAVPGRPDRAGRDRDRRLPRGLEGHPVHAAVPAQGRVRERAADPQGSGRPDRRRGRGQDLRGRAGGRRLAGRRRDDEARRTRRCRSTRTRRSRCARACSSRATCSSTSGRARRTPATWTTATRFPSRRPRRRSSSTRCSGTLTTDTREDLQKLLIGYGDALNGQPQPGEDDDQDPDTKGETAGKSLNDSLKYSADALRGGAILNDATARHGAARPLQADRQPAEDLRGAVLTRGLAEGADHQLQHDHGRARGGGVEPARDDPRAAAGARGRRPALDNLNAAFPSTRAWALEMIPGVRETPATIDAGFPWIRQTRALLSPAELQGLVDDLQPAVADFAEFTDGQLDFLPVLDDFNRCQLEMVLPGRRAADRRRGAVHRPAELRGVLPGDGLARGRVAELRRQRHLRAHPGGRALRGPDPVRRSRPGRSTGPPASSRSARAPRSRPSLPTSRT